MSIQKKSTNDWSKMNFNQRTSRSPKEFTGESLIVH